jgi:hypothetical protein
MCNGDVFADSSRVVGHSECARYAPCKSHCGELRPAIRRHEPARGIHFDGLSPMLRLAPTAFEEITFPDQPMFTDLTNCARKTALSETEGHAAITTLNRPWPRGVERSGGQLAEPN